MSDAWLFLGAVMVFIMQAGFALLEAGSVRAKNTKNILLKNVMDVCLGALAWWAVGYGFAFGTSKGASHFIGLGNFFITDGDVTDCNVSYAFFIFQWAFATTSATIVSGAVAERCQFRAYLAYTVLITSFVYPVVVHWVWSAQGWLSPFNTHAIAGTDKLVLAGNGVIDHAGSGVVHITGGGAALLAAIVIGPRSGRFCSDGRPRLIQGHSSVLSALGTFILWYGWYAYNGFAGLQPEPLRMRRADAELLAANVAVKMTLSASSGCIVATVVHLLRFNYLDVQPALNGIICALVAVSASCEVVDTYAAAIIGAVAAVVWSLFSWLLLRRLIDDPLDASAVHLGGGLWGLLAVGLFATEDGVRRAGYTHDSSSYGLLLGGGWEQLGMQLLAMLVITLWTSTLCGGLFLALSRLGLLRVPVEAEVSGLDYWGHGGAAYILESAHRKSTPHGPGTASAKDTSATGSAAPDNGMREEAQDTLQPLPGVSSALKGPAWQSGFVYAGGAFSESVSSIWDRHAVLGFTARNGAVVRAGARPSLGIANSPKPAMYGRQQSTYGSEHTIHSGLSQLDLHLPSVGMRSLSHSGPAVIRSSMSGANGLLQCDRPHSWHGLDAAGVPNGLRPPSLAAASGGKPLALAPLLALDSDSLADKIHRVPPTAAAAAAAPRRGAASRSPAGVLHRRAGGDGSPTSSSNGSSGGGAGGSSSGGEGGDSLELDGCAPAALE